MTIWMRYRRTEIILMRWTFWNRMMMILLLMTNLTPTISAKMTMGWSSHWGRGFLRDMKLLRSLVEAAMVAYRKPNVKKLAKSSLSKSWRIRQTQSMKLSNCWERCSYIGISVRSTVRRQLLLMDSRVRSRIRFFQTWSMLSVQSRRLRKCIRTSQQLLIPVSQSKIINHQSTIMRSMTSAKFVWSWSSSTLTWTSFLRTR